MNDWAATKIIATLGPATASAAAIEKLIKAGVNIFRLNFSHGDIDSHARSISSIRKLSAKLRTPIGIMQDLPGPKIRVGEMPPDGLQLKPRQEVALVCGEKLGQGGEITVQYPGLCRDLRPGNPIYLNDGAIKLRVEKVTRKKALCRVEVGGLLTSHKGLNLPGTRIDEPTLTPHDCQLVKFGIAQKVDFIAMSFVRSAGDIVQLKKLIRSLGGDQFVIAKIEKREAIDDFENILKQTDGVMVARGDLGIEMPIEDVPGLQKSLIAECNRAGVPVITATQVLESMIQSPRPTRAEATDAANAVLDGTDALMLSGETAIGQYPVEAVRMLRAIAIEAEKRISPSIHWEISSSDTINIAGCVARSVSESALDLGIGVIAAPTRSGHTARLISRYRPAAKIIAFSQNAGTRQHLLLSWGVLSIPIDQKLPFNKLTEEIRRLLLKHKLARAGENIIITAGSPRSRTGATNLMLIEAV